VFQNEKTITTEELASLQGTPSSPLIFDVRPLLDFRAASHWIAGARHCEVEALNAHNRLGSATHVVFYCDDGSESRRATALLSD
jgi:rhodanese-related sulfurtransferase